MTNKSISQLIGSTLDELFKNKKISGIYKIIIQEVEKILINKVMKITNYNKKLSARILGISRNTLDSKIKILGLNFRI